MSEGRNGGSTEVPATCRMCAVSHLISSFADAMDRRDLEALAMHFTEDAVFVMPNGDEWRGREEVKAGLAGQLQGSGTHMLVNHLIDVDGDRATSSTDILVTDVPGGVPTIMALARYEDELCWEDAQWRFARKRVSVKGQAALSDAG